MNYIDNIAFAILIIFGIVFFVKNIKKIIRNIKLGNDINRLIIPKTVGKI